MIITSRFRSWKQLTPGKYSIFFKLIIIKHTCDYSTLEILTHKNVLNAKCCCRNLKEVIIIVMFLPMVILVVILIVTLIVTFRVIFITILMVVWDGGGK